MDSWERFDETSLPNKEARYSKSNLEELKMKTMSMLKTYGKHLKQKNLGEYHDLYVQSDK